MPEVKILFLGIGSPVPTFIRNRIMQLDKTGLVIPVVLVPHKDIDGISLKSGIILPQFDINQSFYQYIIKVLWSSLRFPISTIRFWQSLDLYPIRTRIKTFIKYHSIVRINGIKIVHFQWIASAEEIKWAKRYFRVPVIISARGSQLTVYPATVPGYETKIRESLLNADYIHSVSKGIALTVLKFGSDPRKIIVNYNGIDLERLNSLKLIREDDKKVQLISTGSLMWRKGFMWQLLLVKGLKEAGKQASLKILGDGPDHQGLQYNIMRLGIQGDVILAGNKSSEEVIRNLYSSDIYISTSAAEGLSNSVLEAIACGLPVIAFECEGMNEVIENGYNGFIVPFGDLGSMIEKVQLLINDRKLHRELSSNGIMMVKEKFDSRIHIDKIIDFYKSTLIKWEK